MTEKIIERYFCAAVKALGGIAYKFNSVGNRGVSDRVACLPGGLVFFVEIKAPNGRLSPLQIIFANNMRTLAQNYAVLNSKERVDEWVAMVKPLCRPN